MSDVKSALSIQSNHIKAKFRFPTVMLRLARSARSSEAYRLVKEIIDVGVVSNKLASEKCKMDFLRLTLEEGGSYDISSMLKMLRLKAFYFMPTLFREISRSELLSRAPSGAMHNATVFQNPKSLTYCMMFANAEAFKVIIPP